MSEYLYQAYLKTFLFDNILASSRRMSQQWKAFLCKYLVSALSLWMEERGENMRVVRSRRFVTSGSVFIFRNTALCSFGPDGSSTVKTQPSDGVKRAGTYICYIIIHLTVSYCVLLAVEGGTFTEVLVLSHNTFYRVYVRHLNTLLYLHQIKALNVIKNH